MKSPTSLLRKSLGGAAVSSAFDAELSFKAYVLANAAPPSPPTAAAALARAPSPVAEAAAAVDVPAVVPGVRKPKRFSYRFEQQISERMSSLGIEPGGHSGDYAAVVACRARTALHARVALSNASRASASCCCRRHAHDAGARDCADGGGSGGARIATPTGGERRR